MKKKLLVVFLAIISTLSLAFGLSACGGGDDGGGSGSSEQHVHSYTETVVEPSCEKWGYTLHTCECGDSYQDNQTPPAHKWNDGEITTLPTCMEKGVKTYTCSVCGSTKTEQLATSGHNLIHHEAVAATCTEDGTKEYWSCSVCEKSFLDAEGKNETYSSSLSIEAFGHEWGEPTYTWNGIECTAERVCANDANHKETETVTASSHTVAPTCTTGGYDTYTAVFENSSFDEQITAANQTEATGHTLIHHDAVATTCTESGNIEYWSCSVCERCFLDAEGNEENYNLTIRSSGHEWDDNVCTVCGEDAGGSKGLEYSSGNGYYYVSGIGTCTDTEIEIPETYNGRTVTAIEEYAFDNCASITSITIPDTIVKIENYAFNNCVSLMQIVIPESVTSIGSCAFYGCTALTSIGVSMNNTKFCSVDGVLFTKDKTYLACYPAGKTATSYTVPDGVTDVSNYAFSNCNALESVTITHDVTYIREGTFKNCASLSKVIMWGNITGLGNFAFVNCTSLANITLDATVTSIGVSAFEGCTALTDVAMRGGVKKIGGSAFKNCYSLTEITVLSTVTSIGSEAFYGCYQLVSVYNLSSLNIVKGATDNGYVAYYALDVYTSAEEQNKLATTEDGYIFYEDGDTVYLVGYTGTETELTLPQNYNEKNYAINKYAFADCTSLTSITIPDGVTGIGESAFEGCTSLTSVTIGSGVTSIGDSAFENCHKLIEVYNLSSLELTAGAETNGYAAYYALDVYISADEPSKLETTGDGYVFYENGDTVYLMGYTGTGTALVLPDSYNDKNYEIYKYAFYNNASLKSVTIPDGVTGIGENAFVGCVIENATMPASAISHIPQDNLKTVVITSGEIDNNAFYQCKTLASVTIGNGVTTISEYAFYNCSRLTSITISDGVTSIGKNAFSGDKAIKSITIPNSVTSIGSFVFYGCSGLTSVTIGNGVTTISEYAFYN
ncbi:MAG: leucine-rich repeat domain-containing protein, partial [Candidatus Coproplasma sp.]